MNEIMFFLIIIGFCLALLGIVGLWLLDNFCDEFLETHETVEKKINKKWWASFITSCIGVLMIFSVIAWNFYLLW